MRHSALLLLVAGCATAPAAPAPAPLPIEELPEGPSLVRSNPARCPCPDWEVRLAERWERVHIEDVSEDGLYMPELLKRATTDDRNGIDGRYLVDAELTKQVHAYRGGRRFRVLRVAGDPPPPEPVPSPEDAGAETPAETPAGTADSKEPPPDTPPPAETTPVTVP
jgi:hypothetical protein